MSDEVKRDLETIRRTLGGKATILETKLGGNSKVFIVSLNKVSVVAKKYLGNLQRINLSMDREIDALEFLKSKNIKEIPELLLVNKTDHIIVMEYLEGKSPNPDKDSMEAILNFSKLLDEVYRNDDKFNYAIDGISKSSDLLIQIEDRLVSLAKDNVGGELIAQAKDSLLRLANLNLDSKVWNPTYSVSDLGLHNMVKGQEGFRFFDLEFFGADSPIKLIGDFLLHPKNNFPNHLCHRFFMELKQFYGVTESAIVASLPLIALKWFTIVLPRSLAAENLTSKGSERETFALAQKYLVMSRATGDELLNNCVY